MGVSRILRIDPIRDRKVIRQIELSKGKEPERTTPIRVIVKPVLKPNNAKPNQ